MPRIELILRLEEFLILVINVIQNNLFFDRNCFKYDPTAVELNPFVCRLVNNVAKSHCLQRKHKYRYIILFKFYFDLAIFTQSPFAFLPSLKCFHPPAL